MKTYQVEIDDSSTKYWYQNDKLHREDGPAVEYANGSRIWYINGKLLTEKEFNDRPSCAGKIITIAGKKYKLVEV